MSRRRFFHKAQELPRVCRERFNVAGAVLRNRACQRPAMIPRTGKSGDNVRVVRGMVTVMFFKLCSARPVMTMSLLTCAKNNDVGL